MKRALLLIAVGLVLQAPAFAQSPGDIIITEWMANPATLADADGEYIEVYNTTLSAIDMNGWVLADDGIDSVTIGASVIVPAGGYATLAASATPGFVPTYDYSTAGTYYLGNTDDEIVLLFGAVEIARVNYTNGDPFGAGVSAELNDIANHTAGVTLEANYIAATDNYNGDLGSPNAAGNTVPVELMEFVIE